MCSTGYPVVPPGSAFTTPTHCMSSHVFKAFCEKLYTELTSATTYSEENSQRLFR